jgi:hypothetical protein
MTDTIDVASFMADFYVLYKFTCWKFHYPQDGKWVANEKNARSQDIFLDYIEIVYICTHIGIESVSGDGLQLATHMRQAQRCWAPL